MRHNDGKTLALLIGIDRYSQQTLEDGTYYPSLGGCVRDIELVEQMLTGRLGLDAKHITKLISEDRGNEPKDDSSLPTYENLVKAFKDVTDRAGPGDQVYIHYSGHGGRTLTMFGELKGPSGLDESLVPCDIGANGPCFLRDIEIAYLLKAMSEKGLIVTLVLDSCHSGGATRGLGGAVARGVDSIYSGPQPDISAVAPTTQLVESFRSLPPRVLRSVHSTSGWSIPVPENFVLLAACRANELANEYAFDGNKRNGALTYWMVDALRQIGDGYTYRMLHNRIVAKVHAKFADQTPQIEGDADRQLFRSQKVTSFPSINVTKVDLDKHRVQLNTGVAQGVQRGAQFAIFEPNASDLFDSEQRLAVVEATDVAPTETWAKIVSDLDSSKIQEGAQAILLGPGVRMRSRIRLVSQHLNDMESAALEALRSAVGPLDDRDGSDKWIDVVDEGDADFQVAVNSRGEYEIWDASGKSIPNIRPSIGVNDTNAQEMVVARLVHLTKFRNISLIDNTDPTSPLARKLVAELGKVETNEDGIESFKPFGARRRPLSVGEEFCLRVTNKSKTALNIAILDLQPDWGVSQIYPDQKDYELLESGDGNAYIMRAAAALPDDYKEGHDTLKVFATVEGTSFSWLEMPPLDQPSEKRNFRSTGDALEQMIAAFGEDAPTRQVINLSAPKGRSWTTTEVELLVRRPSIAHVADPALSMLQSAFDETIARTNGGSTRSVNGVVENVGRPELSDPVVSEIAQYCVALANGEVSERELTSFDERELDNAQKRGAVDVVKYCASMAAGLARQWFNAKVWGDDKKYEQYKTALNERFGSCDPNYRKAMEQFLEFLRNSGHVPYRAHVRLDDFVIEGCLPANATIGVVADWATGEPEALEVLRQVRSHQPDVAMHLGDIYYAGTEYEVENYFYQPWTSILGPGVKSFALPGNHDLYAGGKPFYDMIDRIARFNGLDQKPASYFCLRNDDWQLIGMDTALHDRLIGGTTRLEESELEWLNDKLSNSGNRRTVLLSHHQLFSANDRFDGRSWNKALYDQLEKLLPSVDLWLWGHEHDLVIFDPFMGLRRGRCIGGSAYPVGNFEMPATHVNPEVGFNKDVALSKGDIFYQHCYAILRLNGRSATATYYEDSNGGRVLFEETL